MSDALVDEVGGRGCLRHVAPPVPLHLGHAGRYLERQLVVARRQELDTTTKFLRQGVDGSRRPRGAGTARLDGAARLPQVFARRLEVLSPLIGGHRLVRDW